jgi:hypothetical protein
MVTPCMSDIGHRPYIRYSHLAPSQNKATLHTHRGFSGNVRLTSPFVPDK